MQARHPKTKQKFYFVDKCLPFGSSRSCMIFQEFSDALMYVMQIKIQNLAIIAYTPAITNYLDDFLFIALCVKICVLMMQTFFKVTQTIGCPISEEKTEGPVEVIVFLGTLLNWIEHSLSIPEEKVHKATFMLNQAMDNKKVTIKFVQQLTGTLNFLNRGDSARTGFYKGALCKTKDKKCTRYPSPTTSPCVS